VRHVARMGEMTHKFQLKALKGRDHSVRRSLGWRIILEWISGKFGGKTLTLFVWLWVGASGGLL
jgi:hypothetical protein